MKFARIVGCQICGKPIFIVINNYGFSHKSTISRVHKVNHSASVFLYSLREVATSNIGSVMQFPFQSCCSSVRNGRLGGVKI